MSVSAKERVVLVDEDNQPIGWEHKDQVHHQATPLHRAFSVFLFDDSGRMLLQQRALIKPTWGGVWSNACCGHPAPGEATAAAAQRRLREELGLSEVSLALALPDFRYRACWHGVWENEICPVFVGRCLNPPQPNPAEVAAVRWIDWAEFAEDCLRDDHAVPAYSPWCRWEARQLQHSPVAREYITPATQLLAAS